MGRICTLWEFKHRGISYGENLAREFLKHMWKDNVALLVVTKQMEQHRVQCTALGKNMSEKKTAMKKVSTKGINFFCSNHVVQMSPKFYVRTF